MGEDVTGTLFEATPSYTDLEDIAQKIQKEKDKNYKMLYDLYLSNEYDRKTDVQKLLTRLYTWASQYYMFHKFD